MPDVLAYDLVVISSTPIFACADVDSTLKYYKEVLGFDSTWTWGEPPTFGGASCMGVSIMFSLQPDLAQIVGGHQHWIKVDDADTRYEEHLSRGAKVVSAIEDRPWGVREYVLEDPNGYHLRFAGPLSTDHPESGAFPEGVQIVRRMPDEQEFRRIVDAAFGSAHASVELLCNTWRGVVALSPSGEPIGTARIMHDASGWFSLWDVAVVPEWQGRRIGAAIMNEAMAMVREESPGAFVFLFTFKHGFYERLGFARETVSMRRV